MIKSKAELKRMYNQQNYLNMYNKKPLSRLLNLIKYMHLTKKQNVVDFGCGNGMLLEVISNSVSSYIGIDYSHPLINAAIKRKERIQAHNSEFICGDIHEFCNSNINTFDVAFAMGFSEHVLDKDWLKILLSMKKSLKNNGLLYIHTPNSEFFLEIMKADGFLVAQKPGHIAIRTPDENNRLLQMAGFTIQRLKLIPHYNILRYIHFLSYIPHIGKYFTHYRTLLKYPIEKI